MDQIRKLTNSDVEGRLNVLPRPLNRKKKVETSAQSTATEKRQCLRESVSQQLMSQTAGQSQRMHTRDCLQKETVSPLLKGNMHHIQHITDSAWGRVQVSQIAEEREASLRERRPEIVFRMRGHSVSPLLKGNMHHIQLRLAPQCIAFVLCV